MKTQKDMDMKEVFGLIVLTLVLLAAIALGSRQLMLVARIATLMNLYRCISKNVVAVT